jgi:hypothetical protein
MYPTRSETSSSPLALARVDSLSTPRGGKLQKPPSKNCRAVIGRDRAVPPPASSAGTRSARIRTVHAVFLVETAHEGVHGLRPERSGRNGLLQHQSEVASTTDIRDGRSAQAHTRRLTCDILRLP